MATKTLDLTITAGPDTQGCGGSFWGASTDEDTVGTGGTPRGPRDNSTAAWFAWLQRQVRADMSGWRFDWANATITEDGWSPGKGHAPNGIRVKVSATER